MKTILSLLCVALLATVAAGGEIRSHRGNPFLWQEHCIGSYTELGRYTPGVGWTELDVQLSSDGVPVVIHDLTLDRTTNVVGTGVTVVSKTLAQLKALTLDEGTPFPPSGQVIPTLEEALNFWRPFRIKVLIECKVNNEHLAIEAIIHKTGFPRDRVAVLIFDSGATINQYRATTLRYCPIWKVQSGSPVSLGAPVLASLKAEGWDGLSFESGVITQTDFDLMDAAGLLYGPDERFDYAPTGDGITQFTTDFARGAYFELTDDAGARVTAVDDVIWSSWAATKGVDTNIANRAADPDADGLTNFEELVFGTDPLADGLVPAPYGYTVRYSGSGAERRGILAARTKPGEVSYEFWWFRAEESVDGVTWTAVPSNRYVENNAAWPSDPAWHVEVNLGAVSSNTRVRLTPQLFPRP